MAASKATTSATAHGYNLRSGSGNADGYNLRSRKILVPKSVRVRRSRIAATKEGPNIADNFVEVTLVAKVVEPTARIVTQDLATNKPSPSTLSTTSTPSTKSTSGAQSSTPDPAKSRYSIPSNLASGIKSINDGEVELTFPLDGLTKSQRLIWGLPPDSTALLVRLNYGPAPAPSSTHRGSAQSPTTTNIGFCVHMSPSDGEDAATHQYLRAGPRPWPDDAVICTPHENVLTYVAARKLYIFLSCNQNKELATVEKVHTTLAALIRDNQPANRCVICWKDLGVKLKMYRATTCSETCRDYFDRAPLAVRVSPFLLHPLVLDFLLCCVSAVPSEFAYYGPGPGYVNPPPYGQVKNPLAGCPVPPEDLAETINSFPQLTEKTTLGDIIGHKNAHGRKQRWDLLSWIVNEFRGCMIPAPEKSSVPGIPDRLAFIMLNSDVNHYRQFSLNLAHQQTGEETGPRGGWAVFHGTPPSRVFPILRGGLSSNRQIYCSDLIRYSLAYARKLGFPFAKWKNSLLPTTNFQVVFGCELAQTQEPLFNGLEYSFGDKARVTLRYVFLLPSDWNSGYPGYSAYGNPRGKVTRPAMEKVYRMLHAGELLEE